ncbi:MAG: 50S ribosomal protein L24 [Gemmatimonadota bacterium]|nr:50S ribosomal protein L24 [Gemmatimonadota bacterium]
MRILTQRKTRGKKNVTRHQRNAERSAMYLSRGDTVRVMRGDDKGKEGKVVRVYLKKGRVLVEGINIMKKHQRARTAEEVSGIIDIPVPVAVSNLMLIDPKSGKPTRIRARLDADGTKERVSAKSGQPIPHNR